jgi:hypothetical protein
LKNEGLQVDDPTTFKNAQKAVVNQDKPFISDTKGNEIFLLKKI